MFNQSTNQTMSKKEMIALRAMQTWTVCLALIAIVGFAIALTNLITGNFHSTTAFEF